MSGRAIDTSVSTLLSRASYRHSELCERDIMVALQQYRDLRPKMDKFVFNDGRIRDLLCLAGTIPVNYRGTTYHIPVSLWILETHPDNAPVCYVEPTPDMRIKVSANVDSDGKIYMPYLHEWSRTNSDLLGLIQICIITFSENPPVFSVPASGPYPRATRPPYPSPYLTNDSNSAFPPYPPGPPTHSPPYPPPYPQASVSQNLVTGYLTSSGYTAPESAYRPQSSGSTITQEHLKASLLSAVEDKVRRTLAEELATKQVEVQSLQKIEEELKNGSCRLRLTLERLDKEVGDLKCLQQSLTTEKEQLEKQLDKLSTSADGDDLESAEDLTAKRAEEAVDTVAPLFKQLVDAFAEEAAIEDTIYYLGDALSKGVIDCETFLKHVRNLSRKQFFLRAIMQKARDKAGLAV